MTVSAVDARQALPVAARFLREARSRTRLRHISVVVVQHLLEDTAHFVQLLKDNEYEVSEVIGIEYSRRPEIALRLSMSGFRTVVPPLSHIGATIRTALRNAPHRLLIQEVGGYCADIMQADHRALPPRCLGIVEETKQGLWRYSRLRSLSCPVFQIADSRLKNVEGRYVGEAVVRALLEDIAQLGFRRRGCTVGVLGAGIIGRAILKGASSAGLDAICWDRDPVARLEASTAGFVVTSRREVIHGADVIVGASGKRSIRIGDLREMRDGVLLASASSRRIELPITSLLRAARRRDLIGHVARLELKSGKTLHVSDDGCPINFRHSSLPIELADLMFAQIAVGFGELAANLGHAPLIRRLSEPDQARIARSWTRQYLKPRR